MHADDAFVYYNFEFNFRLFSNFLFSEDIFQIKSIHEEYAMRIVVRIFYG